MNKLFLIVLLCLFSSCSDLSKVGKIKQNFVRVYAQHLRQEYDIRFSSAWPIDNGKKLNLNFFSYKKLDIDESRQIIVENVENLLYLANNDIKLKNCFNESEWNYLNIQFDIIFINKNGDFIDDQFVAHIFLIDGIIYYSKYNSNSDLLMRLHEESYQKAKGLVEHQKNLKACESMTGIPIDELFTR